LGWLLLLGRLSRILGMDYDYKVGMTLLYHRETKGFSQNSFGLAVGIHASGICRIELGTRALRLGELKRMADVLGMQPEMFVMEVEQGVRCGPFPANDRLPVLPQAPA